MSIPFIESFTPVVMRKHSLQRRLNATGIEPNYCKFLHFDEISISKGILEITISFLRGSASYKFRFQNGDLYLIGGSSGGVSGGRYYGFDANFSTRRAKIEEGPIDEDKTKVKWVSLPKTPLKKLREMRMIFQWEVVKDHYL